MNQVKRPLVWLSATGVAILGGLSLSACASTNYDQRMAEMNTRLSAVDARATAADQKADQALSADQSAQAASARVNERVDTLTTTVDGLEQAPPQRRRAADDQHANPPTSVGGFARSLLQSSLTMSDYRRAMLAALALGAAVVLPVGVAFAQDQPPDAAGAVDALPDAPAPTYPWVDSAPADEAPASAPARPPGRRPSGIAQQLAEWVAATDDNGDLPFIVVDKLGARIFAFDVGGEFLGSAPVLVGLARGDQLSARNWQPQALPDQPGRAHHPGRPVRGWIWQLGRPWHDALGRPPRRDLVAPGDKREPRRASPSAHQVVDPGEHRISYGCINVPKTYYDDVVLTALAGGNALVYILPDTKAIGDIFPAFAATLGGRRGGSRQASG